MADAPAVAKALDPSSLVTRDQASAILGRGYPSVDELKGFPLSEWLISIPDVDPRYGRQPDDKPGHIERVLEGMNILLSDHPERIVKQFANEKPFKDTVPFELAYQEIFPDLRGKVDGGFCRFESLRERDAFFRLIALYHDIGKAVITERHPLVGWHLLKDVLADQVSEDLFPLILGRPYDEWRRDLANARGSVEGITSPRELQMLKIFNAAVRFHDYFGVLSTGEASPMVMVDLIDLRGVDPADAREMFSVLMIFSLADVYGSVSEVLPQKVNTFCQDWRLLCDLITHTDVHGDRAAFFDALRVRTQTPGATIDRLWRLVYEGAPGDWREDIGHNLVEEIFRESTLSRMYPFINNFALFCKLDYCLAFKIMIMSRAKNLNSQISIPINEMVTLLAELEKRYGDLCQRHDGTWRRIGVEMAGLTRRPGTHKDALQRTKSRIGETISDLLLRPGGLGKEWAVSECTVWFMEE